MELVRVDTRHAYKLIHEKIITLQLAPGEAVNDQALARELGLELPPVVEALKLLAHDGLVVIKPKGIAVAGVSTPDLEQLSELRLLLEAHSARLAAERATADDLTVLDALCEAQTGLAPGETERLLDVDHKFHQAVAGASHNQYLAAVLESLFGLSQRLWYLVLPELEFLPGAVEMHVELVEAIRGGDGERAASIMRSHVADFYGKVHEVLARQADPQ